MKYVDSSLDSKNSARQVDYGLILALLLSLLAATPLLIGPGIVNTRAGGDSPFLIIRVHQLVQNIQEGIWPARWMPDAAYGLGYPFFNFYASLPYYIAAILSQAGLGILWGIKVSQTLGFLCAGGVVYLLTRRLGARPFAALLASAIYTFAPFHLVNVYVRGDSLSEFYAMALYPLVGWALLRLSDKPTFRRAAVLAASYGFLMLSHNISVMLFSPLLALWLVAIAWKHQTRWRMLLLGGAAISLGFMISAWFWAPAIREQALAQLGDQTTGYFHYAGHFLDQKLVQPRLIHDYGITDDQAPFAMGLLQSIFAVAGLVTMGMRLIRKKRIDTTWWVMAVALFGYTWLMTSSSHLLWEHIPLLPFAQFPWRLLSVQALPISLVAALIVNEYSQRWRMAITMALIVVTIIAGMGGMLHPDHLPVREAEIDAWHVMAYETYSINIGSTIRHEYLPQEMVPRPYTSGVQLNAGRKPTPLALEGQLTTATIREQTAEREVWQVEVTKQALLAFHTTYFPGWEATVDGVRQGVEPLKGLGLIGLRLEPGIHNVILSFEPTPVRRYAEWISFLGWVILLAALLDPTICINGMDPFARKKERTRAAIIASLLGAIILWLAILPSGADIRLPEAEKTRRREIDTLDGPLVMDTSRAPWLHHEPDGIQFGSLWLNEYELSQTELIPGESLAITFHWRDTDPSCEARVRLYGASAYLFDPCPVWADIRGLITTREQTLTMPIPQNLAPGLYVVRIEVRQAGERVPIRDAQGVSMDRLASQPMPVKTVRVANEASAATRAPLGQFGPEGKAAVISLIEASVSAIDEGDWVEVELTWRSEAQAPANYMLSARLKDAGGALLASRDLPPLLGGYPTSLWRPGELISDRVRIEVPKDIWVELPQESIQLEIVLYNRLTLQGTGVAIVEIGKLSKP